MQKNSENGVRETSIDAFHNRLKTGKSSKLTKQAYEVLLESKEGLSRAEIAKEINKRYGSRIANSSLSHPIRNLQNPGLVKELEREKRPGSEHSRHVIKVAEYITDNDVLSENQIKLDGTEEIV